MRVRLVLLTLALLLGSGLLRADYLEVRRSATLKSAPKGDAAVLEQLSEGARLELLEDAQQNGYYHVRIPESEQEGWVYRTFVRRSPGSIPQSATAPSTAVVVHSAGATWVHFDHDFVQTHFPGDLAFSSVTLDGQWRASSRHSLSDTKLSCSGTDGEIHIGAYEDAIDLPTNQRPFSRLAGLPTVAWGLVAEPPNATADDSTLLKDREGSRITFEGYSRVWNEGHYDDEKHKNPNGSSNPNHLLELHPIWKIDAASDSHEDYEFQSTVPAKRYAGYGMLKAGPMLQEISAKAWPLAYSTGGQLFVSLAEESNFYQLPVRITGVQTAPAAVILHADVCAAVGCSGGGVAYRNLRIVARVDSFGQKPFTSGEVTELLGIFSVHLGKAEQLSSHATSAQSAVAVPEALEFFVFARTKERAVRNSKCDPE